MKHAAADQGSRRRSNEFRDAVRYIAMFAAFVPVAFFVRWRDKRRAAVPSKPALLNRIKLMELRA